MKFFSRFVAATLFAFAGASCAVISPESCGSEQEESWIQLFNGEDLTGWTPKVCGYDLGENPHRLFRVEGGELQVSYDDWPGAFAGEFGHLFYQTPYAHYRVRAEYRMLGEQVENGPGWARMNNGFMLHCQAPETMKKGQNFPESIEAQMLAANAGEDRATGNICTPGTHVVIGGEAIEPHVVACDGASFGPDQWVVYEVEVRGDHFRHIINGEVVHDYHARMDPFGSGLPLTEGYIAIQAESAPTQFRKIELLVLDE